MIDSSFHVEEVTLSARAASRGLLVRVASPGLRSVPDFTAGLRAAGIQFAVVGAYQTLQDDAG
jgi:hypothetical protein